MYKKVQGEMNIKLSSHLNMKINIVYIYAID